MIKKIALMFIFSYFLSACSSISNLSGSNSGAVSSGSGDAISVDVTGNLKDLDNVFYFDLGFGTFGPMTSVAARRCREQQP